MSRRTLRLLEVALVTWVVAWLGLGVAVGIELHHLGVLSRSVVQDGRAAEAIGTSLTSLRDVPFVGRAVAGDGSQLRQAGAQAQTSARSATGTIDALSVLLGVAVALVPSVPALALYLVVRPGRRQRHLTAG